MTDLTKLLADKEKYETDKKAITSQIEMTKAAIVSLYYHIPNTVGDLCADEKRQLIKMSNGLCALQSEERKIDAELAGLWHKIIGYGLGHEDYVMVPLPDHKDTERRWFNGEHFETLPDPARLGN